MGRTCGEPDEIELTRHGGEIKRLSTGTAGGEGAAKARQVNGGGDAREGNGGDHSRVRAFLLDEMAHRYGRSTPSLSLPFSPSLLCSVSSSFLLHPLCPCPGLHLSWSPLCPCPGLHLSWSPSLLTFLFPPQVHQAPSLPRRSPSLPLHWPRLLSFSPSPLLSFLLSFSTHSTPLLVSIFSGLHLSCSPLLPPQHALHRQVCQAPTRRRPRRVRARRRGARPLPQTCHADTLHRRRGTSTPFSLFLFDSFCFFPNDCWLLLVGLMVGLTAASWALS